MLLFSQIKEVEVRYEIGKSVPTFRVIDDLKGEFPGSDITWYCGSDHFLGRERFGGKCDVLGFWDRGDELFFTQKFLIFARKNIDRSRLQLPQNTRFCDSDLPDISSTKIRERLSINMPIDDLVGKDISAYITQNNISL